MMRSLLAASVLALVLLPGCKKKPVDDGMADAMPTAEPAPDAPKSQAPPHVQEMARNFERVYFDFDSATLNSQSKAALDDNIGIMGQFADVKLEVQGHADERGTTDYNLALGQKRADAVVSYMVAKGITSSRVKSVSYGEERPLDSSSNERAYAQNRRAEFVITWSNNAPVQGTAG
jgi:peptidoglycan-associated lipoprotein